MSTQRRAENLPSSVERYVEEGKAQGLDEGAAWAVAWSRYCKYKQPGSPHCTKKPSEYFPGKSARLITRAYLAGVSALDERKNDVRMQDDKSAMTRLARRVALRSITAANEGSVLSGSQRQKINMALIRAGLDGNKRFRSAGAALSAIAGVLDDNGVEWGEALSDSSLRQAKGRISIELASKTDDAFSPVQIRNTTLSFHWDTFDSGVEAVAYLG